MEAVAVVVEDVHFSECPAVDRNLQHTGIHSSDGIHGEHRSNKWQCQCFAGRGRGEDINRAAVVADQFCEPAMNRGPPLRVLRSDLHTEAQAMGGV